MINHLIIFSQLKEIEHIIANFRRQHEESLDISTEISNLLNVQTLSKMHKK